jgi:hypothetical protein
VTQEQLFQLKDKYRHKGLRQKDWSVNEAYTTWEHQTKVYGLQITKMILEDKKTERWKITAEPVNANVLGGEIWMYFSKLHSGVSANHGK